MPIRRLIASAVVAGVLLAGCSDDNPDDAAPATSQPAVDTTTTMPSEVRDIVATALSNGSTFSQLAGMLLDAGLVDTLRGPGPFTVFAPTNAAFDKLPLTTLHAVQADPTLLATVLTYHVVPGHLMLADLEPGQLATVAGPPLTITRQGDQVLVNGFPIAAGDVPASNGVIHVMSDVLVPAS